MVKYSYYVPNIHYSLEILSSNMTSSSNRTCLVTGVTNRDLIINLLEFRKVIRHLTDFPVVDYRNRAVVMIGQRTISATFRRDKFF